MIPAIALGLLVFVVAMPCRAQIDESTIIVATSEADLASVTDRTISISVSQPLVLEDKHLPKLLVAKKLNNLELSGAKLSAGGLRRLGEFKELTSLRLHTALKDTAQLESLAACSSLTSLLVEGLEGGTLDFAGALSAVTGLKNLTIGGRGVACGKLGDHVGRLKALKQLTLLLDCKLPDGGWTGFASHPALTLLELRGCPPPLSLLTELATIPGLAELRITADTFGTGDGFFGDEHLSAIGAMRALQSLEIRSAQVTGKTCTALKACGSLSSLTFWGCAKLTDDVFAEVAAFAKLATVTLNDCPGIGDNGISKLADATALKTLTLYNMPGVSMRPVGYLEMCTDVRVVFDATVGARHPRKGMSPAVRCKKVVNIHSEDQLAACDAEADAVDIGFSPTVDGLKSLLNANKNITWLRFSKATDDHLKMLARCSGLLSVVALQSPDITDGGIAAMAANKTLRVLSVECAASFSDASLTAFKKHASLVSLSLVAVRADGTNEPASKVTDAGLAALSGNAGMRCLCLTLSESVTDAGIASMAKMKKLEYVSLYGASKLTDEAAKALSGVKGLLHCIFWKAPGLTAKALGHFADHKLLCELAFYHCEGIPLPDLKAFYAANPGIILRGGKPRDALGRGK